jgi:hypothetical protein
MSCAGASCDAAHIWKWKTASFMSKNLNDFQFHNKPWSRRAVCHLTLYEFGFATGDEKGYVSHARLLLDAQGVYDSSEHMALFAINGGSWRCVGHARPPFEMNSDSAPQRSLLSGGRKPVSIGIPAAGMCVMHHPKHILDISNQIYCN